MPTPSPPSADPKLRRFFRLLALAREKRLPPLRPLVVDLAPLPDHWPRCVKAALLAVITLAQRAFAEASALAENSPLRRIHGTAENARLRAELAQLKRENQLLRSRFTRLSPALRPHYSPDERLRILSLKLATGWSLQRTADRLLLSPQTVASWLKRFHDDDLVAPPPPVNRYPDFVVLAIQELKAAFPDLGRKKIAEFLAHAGLLVSPSTARRCFKRNPLPPHPKPPVVLEKPIPGVTAREPHHLWHVDLTTVPTSLGLASSWTPFSLPPVFPFAYKVAVVVDHFTRQVIGLRAFQKEPSSRDIVSLLDDVVRSSGKSPRHIVTDKGAQFFSSASRKPTMHFAAWCKRLAVKPRFGAVGQHGSIALIERFMRTLKSEGLRRFLLPYSVDKMNRLLVDFGDWYNLVRPHAALQGLTPHQKLHDPTPLRQRPRFETRDRLPIAPSEAHRVSRVSNLHLALSHFRNLEPLPVVQLRPSPPLPQRPPPDLQRAA